MEEALKKATEEAHQQRMALVAGSPSADASEMSTGTQNNLAEASSGMSKELMDLRK